MARECFCGCGRAIPRFPLGSRGANTRGRLIAERLIWFSVLWKEPAANAGAENDNLENWFDDGVERLEEIRDMLHGELDPRFVDPRASTHWLKYGRGIDVVFQGYGYPTLNHWLKANRPDVGATIAGVLTERRS